MTSALLSSAPSGSVPPPMFMGAFNDADMGTGSYQEIEHRGLHVSSKGTVSATFGIPGLITISSDGFGRNLTIFKLVLDADMSWVCVLKKGTCVHLKLLLFLFCDAFLS